MATLGSLTVRVGADIADFTSDMGRAAKISQQRSDQIKKSLVGATKVIAAAAATAGVALTKMVNDTLKEADQFQKMSVAIGASTEALSQLSFAAEQSGADFESVSKGMGKLQKSVNDANNGLATQKRAFDALGVSTKELANLSPEKQLEVIADGLRGMTNATERTAAAADIFGQRISVGLMPLLLEGGDGIAALRDQADKLGLTLGQDTANSAAAFNDKMNALQSVVTGFGRKLTESILPTLNDLFDKFINLGDASVAAAEAGQFLVNFLKVLVSAAIWTKNAFEATSKILVAFGVVIIETFKALISPITSFVARVSEAFDLLSQGEFKAAAAAIANVATDVKDQFVKAGKEMARAAVDLGKGAFGDLREGIEGVQKVWDENTQTIKRDVVPSFKATSDAVEDTGKELKETAKEADKLEENFKTMQRELEPLIALEEDFNEQINMLTQLLSAGKIDRETFNEWLQKIQLDYKDAVQSTIGFKEATKDMEAVAVDSIEKVSVETTGMAAVIENAFKNLDNTFQDFWSNMLKGGKFSLKSIKDLFLDTLAQMLHAAITRPIVMQIGAAFTGTGGGGTTGAIANMVGSLFSGGGGGGGGGFGGSFGGLISGVAGLFGGGGAAAVGSTAIPYAAAYGGFGGTGLVGGVSAGSSGLGAAAAGISAVPVIGWIIAAFLSNLALVSKGWNAGDTLDTAGQWQTHLAGGGPPLTLDKILRQFGMSNKTASIISGTGIFSALFGRKPPKIKSQGVRGDYGFDMLDGETYYNLKAKGGLFRSDKWSIEAVEMQEDVRKLFDTVITQSSDFAKTLATMAGVDIQDALNSTKYSFDITFDKDPEVAEEQLRTLAEDMSSKLFESVLGSFSEGAQKYVEEFNGLDDRSTALNNYVTALNQLGVSISKFATTSGPQGLQEELDKLRKTSTDHLHQMGIDMLEAMAAFDNTPESMQQIAQLIDTRYRGEIEYLMAIDNLIKNIGQSIADQQQRIRDAVDGPRSFDAIFGEAQMLFTQLATAQSPDEIANIVGNIQKLVDQAFGGLDEAGQSLNAQTLIDFLTEVQQAAEERAAVLAQQVVEAGEVLREQAQMFAESIAAPLDLNVEATEGVTDAVNNQTDLLLDESRIGHENQQNILDAIVQLNEMFARWMDAGPRTTTP